MTDRQEMEALANFSDPLVQLIYNVLCDGAEPPEGEHWEGFVARRIVASLRTSSPPASRASIVTCCVTGDIPGDGGACGDAVLEHDGESK